MMGNNKILTVSYGTFSCTVEGFDNSFEMMKLVAEYFRDLAAEDRLFGAVPPTPDAQVLANLAETKLNEKVEASDENGRLYLRAADDVTGDPGTPGQAAAATAAVISEEIAQSDYEEEEEAAPISNVSSIAERLQRIRAVVNNTPVDADDAYSEDEHADPQPTTESLADLVAEYETKPAEDDTSDASIEDDISAALDGIAEAPEVEEDTVDEDTGEAETALEDLDLADEDQPEEAEFVEEEPVELAAEEDDIEGTLERLLADEEALNDVAEAQPVLDDMATEAMEPAELDESDIAEEEAEAEAEALDAPEEDAEADVAIEAEAEVEFADLAEVPNEDTPETPADTADEAEAAEDQAEDAASEEAQEKAPAEEPLELRNPVRRARVIKVRRADFNKAVEAGRIEEVADAAPEAPAEPEPELQEATVSSLSPEEEAELMADLAKVEAEALSEDMDVPGHAGSDELVAPEAEAEDDAQEIAEAEQLEAEAFDAEDAPEGEETSNFETDVNRLMDKADAEMEEPETAQRQSAFQALKAAVAARKADRGLAQDTENDSVAYQSDLAEVVQPRRPEVSKSEQTQRPETRPAPLRLVAEQRVDAGEPLSDVQPRRVASAETASEDDGDFIAFAEAKGATALPDVLEAAAAFLTFVEGKEQFSRPQLMTKVRQVEQEDFSREEGLRSFGQLLRAGKIEKVAGGRFAVTSEIGYRPDQRAAG